MRKILIAFILSTTIIGCKKEAYQPNYTSFFSQSVQSFKGDLSGNSFAWAFGVGAFQSIMGYSNEPLRVVSFGLISENGGHTSFSIQSRKYNAESEEEFMKVFGVGMKRIGGFDYDFYLSINDNGQIYTSNYANANSEIEILKTEEFQDNSGKKLRVWFRIDVTFTTCICTANIPHLKGGLMIAEFMGYKK